MKFVLHRNNYYNPHLIDQRCIVNIKNHRFLKKINQNKYKFSNDGFVFVFSSASKVKNRGSSATKKLLHY